MALGTDALVGRDDLPTHDDERRAGGRTVLDRDRKSLGDTPFRIGQQIEIEVVVVGKRQELLITPAKRPSHPCWR